MGEAGRDREGGAVLAAWCGRCRSTQPCAPVRAGAGGAAGPYRCVTCGEIAPNPVLRLTPLLGRGEAAGD